MTEQARKDWEKVLSLAKQQDAMCDSSSSVAGILYAAKLIKKLQEEVKELKQWQNRSVKRLKNEKIETLEEENRQLRAGREWVKTADKLPALNKSVCIYYSLSGSMFNAKLESDGWWADDCMMETPTHWRSETLPEPPAGD